MNNGEGIVVLLFLCVEFHLQSTSIVTSFTCLHDLVRETELVAYLHFSDEEN